MWFDPLRARVRRLQAVRRPNPIDAPASEPVSADEIVLAIGRSEVVRLGRALQGLLGPGSVRPDTPARLEAALAEVVERLGGPGGARPQVTRRPAGLYTPEAWQLRLTSVDPSIGDAIRSAIRDGAFAS